MHSRLKIVCLLILNNKSIPFVDQALVVLLGVSWGYLFFNEGSGKAPRKWIVVLFSSAMHTVPCSLFTNTHPTESTYPPSPLYLRIATDFVDDIVMFWIGCCLVVVGMTVLLLKRRPVLHVEKLRNRINRFVRTENKPLGLRRTASCPGLVQYSHRQGLLHCGRSEPKALVDLYQLSQGLVAMHSGRDAYGEALVVSTQKDKYQLRDRFFHSYENYTFLSGTSSRQIVKKTQESPVPAAKSTSLVLKPSSNASMHPQHTVIPSEASQKDASGTALKDTNAKGTAGMPSTKDDELDEDALLVIKRTSENHSLTRPHDNALKPRTIDTKGDASMVGSSRGTFDDGHDEDMREISTPQHVKEDPDSPGASSKQSGQRKKIWRGFNFDEISPLMCIGIPRGMEAKHLPNEAGPNASDDITGGDAQVNIPANVEVSPGEVPPGVENRSAEIIDVKEEMMEEMMEEINASGGQITENSTVSRLDGNRPVRLPDSLEKNAGRQKSAWDVKSYSSPGLTSIERQNERLLRSDRKLLEEPKIIGSAYGGGIIPTVAQEMLLESSLLAAPVTMSDITLDPHLDTCVHALETFPQIRLHAGFPVIRSAYVIDDHSYRKLITPGKSKGPLGKEVQETEIGATEHNEQGPKGSHTTSVHEAIQGNIGQEMPQVNKTAEAEGSTTDLHGNNSAVRKEQVDSSQVYSDPHGEKGSAGEAAWRVGDWKDEKARSSVDSASVPGPHREYIFEVAPLPPRVVIPLAVVRRVRLNMSYIAVLLRRNYRLRPLNPGFDIAQWKKGVGRSRLGAAEPARQSEEGASGSEVDDGMEGV